MSDANSNIEIEDVLSSIRRLVSEDMRRTRPEGATPESAKITSIAARVVPQSPPMPDIAGVADDSVDRIDAAIEALNDDPVDAPPLADPDGLAGDEALGDDPAQKIADEHEIAGSSRPRIPSLDDQFVLTADYRIEPEDDAGVKPEVKAEAEAEALVDTSGDAADAPDLVVDAEPASPRASADLRLDDLVSGDALLATFGSVGPSSDTVGLWEADALADTLPRHRASRVSLSPVSLEETIADLEMAVAARSEDFEPDLGEQMEAEPAAEDPEAGFEAADSPGEDPVVADAPDIPDTAALRSLAWDSVETAVSRRRLRLHLDRPEPAATGHIGVSDPFPAEDAPAAGSRLWPVADDDAPASGGRLWPVADDDAVTYAGAHDDLAGGPDSLPEGVEEADPNAAVESALATGLGDDEADLPQADLPEAEPSAATQMASPTSLRRIFIAPRVDLGAADAADTGDVFPDAAELDSASPDDATPDDTTSDADADAGAAGADGAGGMAGPVAVAATQAAFAEIEAGTIDAAARAASEAAWISDTARRSRDDGQEPAQADGIGADVQEVQPAGLSATQAADLDLLRTVVADLIRQELQGALGERITRNVRRLVRREINRALEQHDLD